MKKKISIGIIAFILIGITMALLYFNFTDAYIKNLPQTDEVTLGLLKNELEYSLKMGIEIDKYYGIDDVVNEFHKRYKLSKDIVIVDVSGDNIYSTSLMAANYIDLLKDSSNHYTHNTVKGELISIMPLNNSNGIEGFIINFIDKSKINKIAYIYLFFSFLIYIGVVGIYVFLMRNKMRKDNILKHAVIIQAIISSIRLYLYYNTIKSSILTQLGYTLEILKAKLAVIVQYHIPLSNIKGVDDFVNSVSNKIQAFDSIALTLVDNAISLEYSISKEFIFKLLTTSILNTLVLSVLLTFLLLEMLNLYDTLQDKISTHSLQLLRGFGFIYFLGICCKIKITKVASEKSRMLQLEIP